MMRTEISEILDFLPCETPKSWVQCALNNRDILLIDHANCEKKAAATAMNLLYRHVDKKDLLDRMSQLAREELLHFQQVVALMDQLGVKYVRLGPSRYASGLRAHIRKQERQGLLDTLIVGAFVEARSCERFALLAEEIDQPIAKFYHSLLRSEARHFKDYLSLAETYADEDLRPHIARFAEVEKDLVQSSDETFRFHSGVPITVDGS